MTVRSRLLVAATCALLLVTGGAALERLGPAQRPAGATEAPISGAWSCPHGGGEGWRAWVSVVNPGPGPVEIRTTTSTGGAAPPPTTALVQPGTLQQLEVAATLPGSATVVEYLGGVVAAGTVVMPPEGGVAAEPCEGSPASRWHVAEASTLRGEAARLVVHNPFAAQAVVDVTLTAGERHIRPGRLQGVVLGPFAVRAFDLNRYALGEEAVTGTVDAVQGRVAAATVITSPGGVRSSLALPVPTTRWFLPGLGEETEIVVRAQPELDAPVSAELHAEQGAIPALDLEAVAAGTAEAFGVLETTGAMVVSSDGDRPMIAGRRMVLESARADPPPPEPAGRREKEEAGARRGRAGGGAPGDDRGRGEGKEGAARNERPGRKEAAEQPPPEPTIDPAATTAAPAAADRWIVPPPTVAGGGPTVVLVQNPGQNATEASVTLIGAAGGVAPVSVSLPPFSTGRFPVPEGAPAAALVEGRGIVAAQATLAPEAFAVILGVRV